MKNKITIENLLLYWLPVLAWAAIIFTFSSQPAGTTSEIDWQDFVIKKSAHLIVFFILCILTYRALLRAGMVRKKALIYAFIFSTLYGVSDEIHQSFIPGRDPRVRDVVIDSFGALLAVYTISILPKMPKRIRSWVESAGLL